MMKEGCDRLERWERCTSCLALFAHCDDVELRVGGTLARMVREGRRVVYGVAVENAYVGAHRQCPPARETLAMRREEARRGAATLGVSRAEFMAIKSYYFSREDATPVYPTMQSLESVNEELAGVVFDGLPPILNGYTIPAVHDRIKKLMLEEQPQLVMTHSPDDRHPDHYCVARVVSLIVDDLRQEGMDIDVWYSEPGAGGAMAEFWPDTFVELSEEDVIKKGASLTCFPSQTNRDLTVFARDRCRAYGKVVGVPFAEAFRGGTRPRWRLEARPDDAFDRLEAGPPKPRVLPLS